MLKILAIIMAFGLLGCGESGKKSTTTSTTHTEVVNTANQPVVVNVTAPPGTPFPSSSQNTLIKGLVIDDPVINAIVKIYDINNTLLETTTSGDDGDFSISITTSLLTEGYIITATGGTMNGQPFLGELKAIYTGDDNPSKANLTIMSTLIAKLAETQAGATLIEKRDNAIAHLVFLGLLAENNYHKTDSKLLNEDSARIDIAVIGIDAWIDEIINDLADGELSATNMSAFANSNGGVLAIKVLGQQETSVWPGSSTQMGVELSATTNNVQSALENAPSWVSLSGEVIEVAPAATVEPGSYSFDLVAGSDLASAKKRVSFTVEVLERVLLLSGDLSSVAGAISNDDKDISIAVASGKLSQNYHLSFYAAATSKDTVRFVLESVPEMPDDERIELEVSKPSSEIIIRNHIEPEIGNLAARPALQNKVSSSSSFDSFHSLVPDSCQTHWRDGNRDGHRLNYVWSGKEAVFLDYNTANPLTTGGDPRVFINRWGSDEDERCRSTLRSSVSWSESGLSSKEAVLFVHGFISSGKLGGVDGDEEYFGAFPKVLSQANLNGRTFNPFLFSWQTNQRFEDAANDLALAIIRISEETKKQVHIVAHSFGGVLVRTLAQGLAANGLDSDFATKHIASITTIGTPHSGILSGDNGTWLSYGGEQIKFPHGTDNLPGTAINFCKAITCYQLGEDWDLLHSNNADKYYKVKMSQNYALGANSSIKGYLGYELAKNISAYPEVPTQVLIGAKTASSKIKCIPDSENNTCQMQYEIGKGKHMGDGLISIDGQRFYPQGYFSLLNDSPSVEELFLNFYTPITDNIGDTRANMIELGIDFWQNMDRESEWTYVFDINIEFTYREESFFLAEEARYINSLYDEGFNTGIDHRSGQYYNGGVANIPGKFTANSSIRVLTEVGLNEFECSRSSSIESNCKHPSWLYVKSFLNEHVAQPITVQQQISVTGRVQEASQSQSQSSPQLQARNSSTTAIVNVYNGDAKVGSQQVVMGESYDISVPFVASSPYRVEVVPKSGSGLRATVSRTITTASSFVSSSLNFGIIDLISNALNKNTLNILVINATTGLPLSGFDYVVRNYNGDFLEDGSENSSQHLLTEKRFGRYHIEITKVGYDKTVNTCTILPLISNQCTLVLSPERTNANGEFTAVLTWDLNPQDLDSHLSKYDSNGTELYHLFYSNKSVAGIADSLDLDDVTSYGPETITIDEIDNSAHYIYAVHHYAGTGSISTSSEAQVSLQMGTENMLLNAPVSGSGKWWKVFEIINSQIIPCTSDCIMDSRPTQAAKGLAVGTVTDEKWLADMEADLVNK
jgi:pimeloyl-ACP methyl ester carboxylesterase